MKAEISNMTGDMKEGIKNFLMSEENVVFALIFGSTVTGHANQLSDLDIGIYLKNKIDLPEIGRIISEIEKITHQKIDLVELNDLYNKNPLLAFEIVSNSELLFSRNSEVLIHFKKRAILHFLDTQRLRETFRNTMRKRIAEGKFGRLNYA